MTHDLKTWTEYFQQVWDGRKSFEVRKNDRGYKVGDFLNLMEYFPELSEKGSKEVFSDRWIHCRIDYILYGGVFGIEQGYVVMSISPQLKSHY
jgi:hypothetical protein